MRCSTTSLFIVIAATLQLGGALSPRLAAAQPQPGGQSTEAEAEARRKFKHGQELYSAGQFLEAAKEFEAGYASSPRPLFLLNIGHSYRKAGQFKQAKRTYEKLLQLEPSLPQRADVESLMKSMDEAIQAGAGPGPNTPPIETALPPPAGSAPLPPPMPRASQPSQNETPGGLPGATISDSPGTAGATDLPLWRRTWFLVAIGAVVAGTVAVALLASGGSSACPANVVCVKETEN